MNSLQDGAFSLKGEYVSAESHTVTHNLVVTWAEWA